MAELTVDRRTIFQLLTKNLTDNKVSKFVIPEYQRPYRWDIEKCETLWQDIRDFHVENKNKKNEEYFLGTIVTYVEDDGLDVIDGQQRLTSFFLLLRAFYSKLEEQHQVHPNDLEIVGLMKTIGECLWDVNRMSKEVTDKSAIHIESRVATDKENAIFHKILETGKPICNNEHGCNSNYAINYKFFSECCDEYALKSPMDWKELCLSILERCIVLPIECKDLDSSLTIFSTLNDRGMALDDSDIFKAQIYKNQKTEKDKENFTNAWRELSDIVDEANISLNDIFRYYSHVIRAINGDYSKEVALRKFFAGKDGKYKLLKEAKIMDDLIALAKFWRSIHSFEDLYCNLEAKQYLHCLNCYPNEYWKYTLSAFFQYYRDKANLDNLKEHLPLYLKKLLAFVIIKFIEKPTVNAIKDHIFQAYIETYKKGDANFFAVVNEIFDNRFDISASSKIAKPVLLLHSYLFDRNQPLLPFNFQIEHIFPQRWDNTYFEWTKEDADKYLNMYGNKIPFERRLNIQASNGFFSKKQEKYRESVILEVTLLAQKQPSEWGKEDIENRNSNFSEQIRAFLTDALNSNIENEKREQLICYEAKGNSYCIDRITRGEDTMYLYYEVDSNGVELSTSSSYLSFEEAYDKIAEGLKAYVQPTYVDSSIMSLIN